MLAILFDLDGTLLEIDIEAFMARYMSALSAYCESLYPGLPVMEAVMAGTRSMMSEHPGRTNQQAFHEVFRSMTGIDLEEQWRVFERFYDEHFPLLRGEARPREGGLAALDAAAERGLAIAVATNPLFPEVAIRTRMEWAGLDGRKIDLVTTYEESLACKPSAAYYLQVAQALGVHPTDCLMVGDDDELDIRGAASVGMRTFYVGRPGVAHGADLQGDMHDVALHIQGR